MKARIEVDNFGAERRTTVIYVDTDTVTAAQCAACVPILAETLAAIDHPDAPALLLACVVELQADAEAYQREAVRRGVLAL